MATMQTPKMYLGVQGMPKKLPVKGFSSELNKALMEKDDTEMAAAAMLIRRSHSWEVKETWGKKFSSVIAPLISLSIDPKNRLS